MDEESKKIILARRARFVAAALASAGILSQSCGGEAAAPCLSMTRGGDGGSAVGGAPQPCLSGAGGAPQPCLSAPIGGSGGFIGVGGNAIGGLGGTAAGTGGAPQPCLGMTLGGEGGTAGRGGDGGAAGGTPQPCLSAPIGGAGGARGNFEPCLSGASGLPDAGEGGNGGEGGKL